MRIPLSRYWALLVDYLVAQRGRFALLAVLLFASIALLIAVPQITKHFIDAAAAGTARAPLLIAAGAFLFVAVVQQCVAVGAAYVGAQVAWTSTNALRADMAEHCLRLDMRFHNDRSPGELIERIDGDVAALAQFFSQLVIQVAGNLLLLAGILVALGFEDWRIGLAFAAFSALALAGLNRMRELAVEPEKARRQVMADLYGFLEERLSGTEDVRASGAVPYVIRGLYRLQHLMLEAWKTVQMRYWTFGVAARSVNALGLCLAIASGYWLFQAGSVTIGTAYLLVHYTLLLGRPFMELTQEIEGLQGVGASIERLEELRSIEAEIRDGEARVPIPRGALGVRFDDVSFGYDASELVLRDLRFELEPGSVTGLLGRTGSGKTTLSRLIFRFYDPTDGVISLGGVDTRSATLDGLRERVAIVTQDVQLFEASVRDNLTFFRPEVPDRRILEVMEYLDLADWLLGLPAGLDTRIESGGRSLSAGEAQLLAFARVFLQDPGLVILDEASSRLDPITERRLDTALGHLLDGRTGIIIAHRLGTILRADNVLILEGGGVCEFGARKELAADPTSRLHQLLRSGLEEMTA